MRSLGDLWLGSDKSPQSIEYGLRCYELAAKDGDDEAAINIAKWHLDPENNSGNIQLGIDNLIQVASKGNAEAQYILASYSLVGNLFVKNETYAMELFSAAAEKGHAGAMYELGLRSPLEEALKYFKKAAGQGHIAAQQRMFDYYFQEATNTKDAELELLVGDCYFRGEGVAKDLCEAQKWYSSAAAREHPEALFKLAEFLYNGYQFSPEEHERLDLCPEHYIETSLPFYTGAVAQEYIPAYVALAKYIIKHLSNYNSSHDRPVDLKAFVYDERGKLKVEY